MTLKVYRESDVPNDPLKDMTVAVIGYGNQGRAHALNLRDSGVSVVVGQRPGASFDRATADGFAPVPVDAGCRGADLIILALPDEQAGDVYRERIGPSLNPGRTFGFIHGFNIRYGAITPPPDVDVVMIAPKGPGSLLRSLYLDGKGLPALVAVHQDASGRALRTALGWAWGIGCTRAGVIETTFAIETETDLFGEQAVLCGGVSALTKAAFETLVEAGYPPEFAYLECVHELKQVVDLLYARGLVGMRQAISHTAEYGDLTRGPRVIDEHVRAVLRDILAEVRDGRFAAEWLAEHRAGGKNFRRLHDADRDTLYERAGRFVRGLMPWLNAGDE